MVISWRLVSRINVRRKSIKEVQWIQIYFCSGYRSWPWRSVWGRPPSVSTWVTVVRAQIWRIKPVGTMNYQEQWDRRPGNLQQKAPTSLWPVSCVWLLVTRWLLYPMTVVRQAPLSLGFPRQEYLGGLPFPSPGNISDPRIEPGSPALQEDSLPSEPPGKPAGC